MTAFASRAGTSGATSWRWEMRGVNARGLDLRLRLPDGMTALEIPLRAALQAGLARGNVTLNLRLNREEASETLSVDETQLEAVLGALDLVQERAFAMGVTLAQPHAADVLSQKGVLKNATAEDDDEALAKGLQEDFPLLLADFIHMRETEGAALKTLIAGQLDQIADLTAAAAKAAAERVPQMHENLSAALRRVVEDVGEIDPQRIAQELALLAVKADVTEEIDRLGAHIAAARDLLDSDGPAGRKLDFLAQEFNREANTLCSKAQSKDLTAIGLDLKAVIDQMREQIQNVE
ncbi:YicC/YloC family endoribonuclease [Cognatiyoonia sp. IB215182]|uniref:YicC/YloC family endoribonuclease n=1 Tax=Cognatiyoonia sp. IB215182 TaxID=3097353 RepID=UPI002A15C910|nr:YicC/YloC family endoribonuclease [Cognatiyoonia sp. IB215182]MDX8351985.1 YicC/YloC family endoribonuclease [Cognatiyoonia sp. IB215182]